MLSFAAENEARMRAMIAARSNVARKLDELVAIFVAFDRKRSLARSSSSPPEVFRLQVRPTTSTLRSEDTRHVRDGRICDRPPIHTLLHMAQEQRVLMPDVE